MLYDPFVRLARHDAQARPRERESCMFSDKIVPCIYVNKI